jgi:hypothetical protein
MRVAKTTKSRPAIYIPSLTLCSASSEARQQRLDVKYAEGTSVFRLPIACTGSDSVLVDYMRPNIDLLVRCIQHSAHGRYGVDNARSHQRDVARTKRVPGNGIAREPFG